MKEIGKITMPLASKFGTKMRELEKKPSYWKRFIALKVG